MRKYVWSVAFALVFAASLVTATGWTETCVLYERWSAQWIALGCWYGEPEPPPCANCA